MRPAHLLCLATLFAICASAYAQTVWKWTDEKGVIHYSDQPGPNAVKVDLNVQTYSSEETNTGAGTRPASHSQTPADSTYQTLRVVSPAAEETIQGTGGQVSVQLDLQPGLRSGDSIELLLDGKQVSGQNSTALSYSLPEVDRGAHTLQARVVNRQGDMIIGSTAVTFYVRVPSVIKPAR